MLAINALIIVVFVGAFFIGRKFGFEIFKGHLEGIMRHLSIESTDVWRKILNMENHFFADSIDYLITLFLASHVKRPNNLQ